jgi:hypothetical protein
VLLYEDSSGCRHSTRCCRCSPWILLPSLFFGLAFFGPVVARWLSQSWSGCKKRKKDKKKKVSAFLATSVLSSCQLRVLKNASACAIDFLMFLPLLAAAHYTLSSFLWVLF